MKQLNFYMINNLFLLFFVLISVMISVAFFTLFERKILSYIHYRKGPNKVSIMGFLQPFSDAMKLLTKEFFFPIKSNFYFFFISPLLMFILILSFWLIYPFFSNLINLSLNSLFFLCLMSMGVYGLMISGWSSNSMFSMMGGMRSVSQSISYEVIFSISFLLLLFLMNSLNLNFLMKLQKYLYMYLLMWPMSMILMISMLAEINRTPFDLSEGESELVSGFNIEYSSGNFVLIFLSEYASIMFMMYLYVMLFFNCSLFSLMFYLFFMMLLFLMIWIRCTLPRIRYDYLMYMCWMYFLPMILIIFMYYFIYIKFFVDFLIFLSILKMMEI